MIYSFSQKSPHAKTKWTNRPTGFLRNISGNLVSHFKNAIPWQKAGARSQFKASIQFEGHINQRFYTR